MGVEKYEASIKKLSPEGDYWDAQFADANSDVSLFCKAKLPELVRFRQRMDVLQSESIVETTEELIEDWERVLLGTVNHGLDINQRRLLLKSKRDVKLNRAELQKVAAMFGLTISNVVFPYRPAFFGWSRFNEPIYSPVVFSVLYIEVSPQETDSMPDANRLREFEDSIQKKLLANHIPLFWYVEGGK